MKPYSVKQRIMRAVVCLLLCLPLVFAICSCNSKEDTNSNAETAQTNKTPTEITVLRVKDGIERGSKITSAKFEQVTLPSDQVCIGAISDPDAVIGKYAAIDLEGGDFFVEKYISAEKPKEEQVKAELENNDFGFKEYGYVVVTDYVTPNTGKDLYPELQKIFNSGQSRNKVIYFPDGEYIISKPLLTASMGTQSIAIKLSNNAVIKASDDWEKDNGAMIKLGASVQLNDIDYIGANYYIEGGIIDGSGRANGVSIDFGRETSVRNITIINTQIGLHWNHFGSVVDSDAENITIIGNGAQGSVGLQIEGSDSTFTNMRISNVQIGVNILSPAHILRNVRVTYVSNLKLDALYESSYGFIAADHRCWFDTCISEGFSTAFCIANRSTLTECVAKWADVYGSGKQVAVKNHHGNFSCVIRSVVAEFCAPKEKCEYLVAASGGTGAVYNPIFDENAVNGSTYKEYLKSSAK
ncbi:MAG: hypothetical protein E7642_05285 [Ruminococcaceae bacterium]|nr:hypothetical protein [Oscillospiraceae bacterium]